MKKLLSLRADARINSQISGVEAPVWQGVRSEDTRRYLSDEQRSQAGCIGVRKWEVIFAPALTLLMMIAAASSARAMSPESPDLLAAGYEHLGLAQRIRREFKIDKSSEAINSEITAMDAHIKKVSSVNRRVDALVKKAEKRAWGSGGSNGDVVMQRSAENLSAQLDSLVTETKIRQISLEIIAHEAPPDTTLAGMAAELLSKVEELGTLTKRLSELADSAYTELKRLDITDEGYTLKKQAQEAESSAQAKAAAAAHLVNKTRKPLPQH